MSYPNDTDSRCSVIIEYSAARKKVFVRAVLPFGEMLAPLDPDNDQNRVDCFFGVDHKWNVGMSPLVVEGKGLPSAPGVSAARGYETIVDETTLTMKFNTKGDATEFFDWIMAHTDHNEERPGDRLRKSS